MPFTGKEDHSIALEEAAKLTGNYRAKAGSNAVKAGFFGGETIKRILNQEGCVGIRIYYGQDKDGTSKLVLTGVNSDEDDIIEGEIAERDWPCPPYCGVANILNS